MYRTYNEFYVLLEQIYSGEYFKDQPNNASGSETPNTATVEEDGEVVAECIELDTFEHEGDTEHDDNNSTTK